MCFRCGPCAEGGCSDFTSAESFGQGQKIPPTTSDSLVTEKAVTRGLLTTWIVPAFVLVGQSGSGSFVVVVLWLPVWACQMHIHLRGWDLYLVEKTQLLLLSIVELLDWFYLIARSRKCCIGYLSLWITKRATGIIFPLCRFLASKLAAIDSCQHPKSDTSFFSADLWSILVGCRLHVCLLEASATCKLTYMCVYVYTHIYMYVCIYIYIYVHYDNTCYSITYYTIQCCNTI